jgi:hypothetical protein
VASLPSVARPKTRTEQIGAFDDAAGEYAVEMLFNDEGLAVLDPFEPVRDVEAVADLLRPRFDEIELGRVGKPAGNQRRSVVGPGALAEARWNERAKLDTAREARRDRRLVLGGDRLHEPRPDRKRHVASLGLTRPATARLSPGRP